MKMQKVLPSLSMALVILVAAGVPALASKHKKDEVNLLITETEKRLEPFKTGESAAIIAGEIAKINDYILKSRALVNKRKYDDAFYEINIGILYFFMIDARIDLDRAVRELGEDQTKSPK
jgi:hypothetical protein